MCIIRQCMISHETKTNLGKERSIHQSISVFPLDSGFRNPSDWERDPSSPPPLVQARKKHYGWSTPAPFRSLVTQTLSVLHDRLITSGSARRVPGSSDDNPKAKGLLLLAGFRPGITPLSWTLVRV
mmetsp:Transcript_9469/g.28246  ORF Transcript_9469/g.28246 Transcript_9469/m.28246 type:complete len:126 (+) Transcript_9469:440-817(+)